MKILILGGNGMIGSNLSNFLNKENEIVISSREKQFLRKSKNCILFEAEKFEKQKSNLLGFDIIINAIGITNKISSTDLKSMYYVNSIFVLSLHNFCKFNNIKLIHLSTNCVFSGVYKNKFKEYDIKDAIDLYGHSKSLSEINSKYQLTLRFSCLGIETKKQKQLFNWYISQKKTIDGFSNVYYNGITTLVLSEIIDLIISKHFNLNGIMNLASNKIISKFELLNLIKDHYPKKLSKIKLNSKKKEYKILDPSLFNRTIKYKIPSYTKMINDLSNAFLK